MGSPLPVVYYTAATGAAGTERYLLNLLTCLDRERFEPCLVVDDARPEELDSFRSQFATSDVPVTVVRAPSRPSAAGRVLWAARLFRRQHVASRHPWILHFNLQTPAASVNDMLGAHAAIGPRIVATNHLPTVGVAGLSRVGRALVRTAYRACDAVVVESGRNRELALAAGLGSEKNIHAVPYGIDLEAFGRDRDAAAGRELLGLPTSAPVIGTVGRLSPQKGHARLLRAVALLSRSHPDLTTVIVGEGEERHALKALVDDLGIGEQVHLLGRRDDVAAILAAFDVFVLPSEYEGLPFALLEAMAAGLPVIAYDVDGVSDAVEHQRTGLLVEPRSVDGLASALATLLDDPSLRESLGRAGAASASAHYGLDRMARETEQIYDHVAGRG
jgi:glycosyltransferase involved in cell wall biosynthesis